jgi:MoaA/NifB/PqqE/SkfB family radical SAM enzyme
MRAIGWAHELGIPLQINTTFCRYNAAHIEPLTAFIQDLGIVFWEVFFLVPLGRGALLAGLTAAECERLFEVIGISKEEGRRKFGFLLEAFQYGAPPHGGVAFGLDRIAMLMGGGTTIRDYIAFPKTQKATDLMTEAPSAVDSRQLAELSLRVMIPK